MAGPADTAIGRIYNFCSVCLEVVCIGLGREKMTLVGLAQALIGIVAVQCSRSLSGTDDGSTLTFHPVPGSVPASSDYEHMTSPPPRFWHFSITAAVSYMVQGNFPTPDLLDFRTFPNFTSPLKNKPDSVLSHQHDIHQTFQK